MSLESIRKKNGSIMDLKEAVEDLKNEEYNLSPKEIEGLKMESGFYELRDAGIEILKSNSK